MLADLCLEDTQGYVWRQSSETTNCFSRKTKDLPNDCRPAMYSSPSLGMPSRGLSWGLSCWQRVQLLQAAVWALLCWLFPSWSIPPWWCSSQWALAWCDSADSCWGACPGISDALKNTKKNHQQGPSARKQFHLIPLLLPVSWTPKGCTCKAQPAINQGPQLWSWNCQADFCRWQNWFPELHRVPNPWASFPYGLCL